MVFFWSAVRCAATNSPEKVGTGALKRSEMDRQKPGQSAAVDDNLPKQNYNLRVVHI